MRTRFAMTRSFRVDRDKEVELRAASGNGLGPDLARVEVDDLLADGEAEPSALDLLGLGVRELIEDAEELRELLRRHPDALVDHGDLHASADEFRADDDAALGRVLDGVVDEVREHLHDAVAVQRDRGKAA